MCNALRELMQPELDEERDKARKEGFKEVIDLITNAALELNNGATEEELLAKYDEDILKSVIVITKNLRHYSG